MTRTSLMETDAAELALLKVDLSAMEDLLLSARNEEMVLWKAQRLEMMGTLQIAMVAVVPAPLRMGLHVILLLLQILAL
jgi:hypothetical protein